MSKEVDSGDHKHSRAAPSATDASTASLRNGYNQTYVIMKNSASGGNSRESKDMDDIEANAGPNEVFFRCGNWCYKGPVDFMGLDLGLHGLPALIPCLQRQQGSLKYFCTAKAIPESCAYFDPIEFFYSANDFIATELTSDRVSEEMKKWSSIFPWIDSDSTATYFELVVEPPACMSDVAIMASKTYAMGLIVVSIYLDGVVYFIVSGGEGDQHLLDVRFPDVSKRGQGLHVASYKEDIALWRKLTLWHCIEHDEKTMGMLMSPSTARIVRTADISSSDYIQSYCILKSKDRDPNATASSASVHEAMFRFGSWCYAGSVQLTPVIKLADIPYVIPALRIQQSRLSYYSDVKHLPATNKFAKALEYLHKVTPCMEEQIYKSEDALRALIDRLNKMNLGDSVSRWLEGDSEDSFFEFRFARTPQLEEAFRDVEVIASKAYHASGVVTVTIIFEYVAYVLVLDAENENPLLDSRFPDVSSKGRGYQLHTFADGIEPWPELRKISVWQTVDALEQEFRERAAQVAQAKSALGVDAAEAHRLISSMGAEIDEFVRPDSKEGSVDRDLQTRTEALTIAAGSKEELNVASAAPAAEAPAKEVIEQATPAHKQEPLERKGEEGPPREAAAKAAPGEGPGLQGSPSGRLLPVSRGHHLPKMDNSLAKKMDELKRSMGPEGSKPSWARDGRPLGGLSPAGGLGPLSNRESK